MKKQTGNAMKVLFQLIILAVLTTACTSGAKKVEPAQPGQAVKFTSPEDAANAFRTAVEANDREKILKIFGENSKGLFESGDEVADRNAFEKFSAALRQKQAIEEQDNGRYVLLVGEKDWPFPIPIVSDGKSWSFDVEDGREEVLDRRIGENELKTIRLARSYVEAQKEYFGKDRDGDRVKEYAQKAISTPGKKDGLYWQSEDGAEVSPFGPIAADAAREGYRRKDSAPVPFHGYFFKILTAQGEAAAGGKKNYLDSRGNMTKGFALLAYPAGYGSSGIMSFIVNQEGVVYEKDLGIQTLAESEVLKEFDPNPSWEPVADPNEDAVEE